MIDLLNIVLLIAAVVLGGAIVSIMDGMKQKQVIKIMLAFSGGFLLSIAFVHFLPELYESDTPYSIGIFILIGFLIQLFLEYFSGGIEHGHIHVHKNNRIPWALFISLSIHSFIEGIPLAGGEVNAHHDHLSAQSLLLGILFHQTPVAIALMTLLKGSGITNTKSWVILISFSLMTPMGLVFGKFAHNAIDTLSMNLLLAIVVGMFLHISTTIIFEASENHRFNLIKLISIIIGVILAVMIA
ncbi:MAG: ZIP family metal transporter [Crocinitomicaceae bacterium]|jgi:zinc transporter ZupT|nr:ZIP family metal transporter [Crocinitomicaceae bacterium]